MNHPLDQENYGGEGEDSPARFNSVPAGGTMRDQEWANELRKADQRSQEIRLRCEQLQSSNATLEQRIKSLEDSIETRDNEILRLGSLYQGGQNNERITLQYHQSQNEKTIAKLQSQVDFVNKENHRLQSQLDIFVKDRTVIDHIDEYRKQVDELTFENHTLRKDLRELTTTLKDF